MAELFPRLDGFAAELLWKDLRDQGQPVRHEDIHHPAVTYTETGGSPVSRMRLHAIRESILDIAAKQGFPSSPDNQQRRRFDFECARFLVEDAGISFPEACRRSVWAYFTLILLPDVTDWRFPGMPKDRWTGGIRNVFGVLWRRGYLIGKDHGDRRGSGWRFLAALSQDAMVQIIERPQLSASPRTARVIAEVWMEIRDSDPGVPLEEVTRDAVRNLIAIRFTQDLDGLDTEHLRDRVRAMFVAAVDACLDNRKSVAGAPEGGGWTQRTLARFRGKRDSRGR